MERQLGRGGEGRGLQRPDLALSPHLPPTGPAPWFLTGWLYQTTGSNHCVSQIRRRLKSLPFSSFAPSNNHLANKEDCLRMNASLLSYGEANPNLILTLALWWESPNQSISQERRVHPILTSHSKEPPSLGLRVNRAVRITQGQKDHLEIATHSFSLDTNKSNETKKADLSSTCEAPQGRAVNENQTIWGEFWYHFKSLV